MDVNFHQDGPMLVYAGDTGGAPLTIQGYDERGSAVDRWSVTIFTGNQKLTNELAGLMNGILSANGRLWVKRAGEAA